MNKFDYAWEKLYRASSKFAASGSLKDRLREAYDTIASMSETDFHNPGLIDLFDAIKQRMMSGGQTSGHYVDETMMTMSETEAQAISNLIHELLGAVVAARHREAQGI